MAAIAKEGVLTRLPIIVILGATGTGKSKLAIQVAKKFNGEIINADAMQMYRGLDIVTNKVSPADLLEVPHHVIDFISPGQPTRVNDFRDRALPIIEDLLERNKLPVVAGGTCYYVESLLWKLLMNKTADSQLEEPPAKKSRQQECSAVSEVCGSLGKLSYVLKAVPGEKGSQKDGDGVGKSVWDVVEDLEPDDKVKLHDVLKKVDPERAGELHPNNVRKVIRSLQVFHSTGRRHSELIKEQRAAGGDNFGGSLRFPNSIILWVTCDKEVLNSRLDARVDDMIKQGLIAELLEFHEQYNKERLREEEGGLRSAAYTLGIFQSIGFKEFHDYLLKNEEERQSEEGQKMFDKGVKLMKIATSQYAKRQIKWIRQRLLGRDVNQVPPLYSLDGTDVNQWDTSVQDKAFSIIQSVLDGTPCPVPPESHIAPTTTDHKVMKCEKCNRFFVGSHQWTEHMNSQKHKRTIKRLEREASLKTERPQTDNPSIT